MQPDQRPLTPLLVLALRRLRLQRRAAPGIRPAAGPGTVDVAQAKALLAGAGYPDGHRQRDLPVMAGTVMVMATGAAAVH